jgi:hypothetical protein
MDNLNCAPQLLVDEKTDRGFVNWFKALPKVRGAALMIHDGAGSTSRKSLTFELVYRMLLLYDFSIARYAPVHTVILQEFSVNSLLTACTFDIWPSCPHSVLVTFKLLVEDCLGSSILSTGLRKPFIYLSAMQGMLLVGPDPPPPLQGSEDRSIQKLWGLLQTSTELHVLQDFYCVYGENALFIATTFYKTSAVVKYIGGPQGVGIPGLQRASFSPHKISYHV